MIRATMKNGFTLVELAIVITIIGLLIGGVLKGQELLLNARMTSAASKQKSLSTAAITFKDIYKALPGDIINPANFLPNCTSAPCNISGDGNGQIGATNNLLNSNENSNFWLHLQRANLVNGIDPNSTWSGSAYLTASMPDFDLGGKISVPYISQAVSVTYPDGVVSHTWYPINPNTNGTSHTPVVPANLIGKFDLKIDDGKPWVGEVFLWNACIPVGATAYDPNVTTTCYLMTKTGF